MGFHKEEIDKLLLTFDFWKSFKMNIFVFFIFKDFRDEGRVVYFLGCKFSKPPIRGFFCDLEQ